MSGPAYSSTSAAAPRRGATAAGFASRPTTAGLRVAYLTGEYLNVSPFVFMYREIAALRDLGVHVETCTIRAAPAAGGESAEQREERERTFRVLPAGPAAVLLGHGRLFLASPRRYLAAAAAALGTRRPGMGGLLRQGAYFLEAGLVARRLRQRGLRHLHNHLHDSSCTVAMLAAALAGATYSFTVHGTGTGQDLALWALAEKVRRARFVCCISHHCRSQIMMHVPESLWERLHVIHCGVDPEQFSSRPRASRGGRRLLFVGRLVRLKGLPIALRALRSVRSRIPDLCLTVVGDGPERAELERLGATLGLEEAVTFEGSRPPARVRELLQSCEVFVLPSFSEGVPVVLMEAMAGGVPVVATRIAGVPELIEDGVEGYLVPPGDEAALAERIQRLLSDEGLRRRMGRAGRARVEREFDIRRAVAPLHALLALACAEGRGAGPAGAADQYSTAP